MNHLFSLAQKLDECMEVCAKLEDEGPKAVHFTGTLDGKRFVVAVATGDGAIWLESILVSTGTVDPRSTAEQE